MTQHTRHRISLNDHDALLKLPLLMDLKEVSLVSVGDRSILSQLL